MKKLFAVILCMCMLTGTISYADSSTIAKTREYELWTQSPSVTCGLSVSEARIYKSLEQDQVDLVSLSKVGENYYMAICAHERTDGGYSGKVDTTDYYFYTLYATADGFIVISSSSAKNEYYWDRGFNIIDISDEIDYDYYIEQGSEVPYYILNPAGKYTNTNYNEYDEYFIVTNSGRMYTMLEDAEHGAEGYPFVKDRILYRGQEKYKSSSSYTFYYMSDGSTKASSVAPMLFKSGTISYGSKVKVAVSDMTSANGYKVYGEGYSSNVGILSYREIPGSDNLFFKMSNVATQDTTNNKTYYYLKIDVYKPENGFMTMVNSKTIPTTNTSAQTYTPKKITNIDEEYYISQDFSIPAVSIGTTAVIGRDGSICGLELDTSIYSSYCYPCTYNGHYAIIRSHNGSTAIYKKAPDAGYSSYWQAINEITFDSNGRKTISEDIELNIYNTPHEGQNGYFDSYKSWNEPDFTVIEGGNVKAWWGRTLSNVFPDGRSVKASWMGMGGGLTELWYNIYHADGTLKSTGPTGYSYSSGSAFSSKDLICWAINDSKFVVTLSGIGETFLVEYYRIAVVEETEDGEVVSKIELGEKTIKPPATSDTEVVQSKIDFGSSELPLGYNIKDNVINFDKLDVDLREQINSIRLNDIVIVKKDGYQSGEQNTGVTLEEYSLYDDSYGASSIRLYTNGQYFRWYCNNPEDLTPGTYSRSITIGDKTIYVTFKIIQSPSNEGTTTVVF